MTSDVKRLLAEATPLPWAFDVDEDEGGVSFSEANALLILEAVNHLPAYEALADAAESCLKEWDTLGPTGTQDTITEHATLRAALARLRVTP